MERKYTRRPVPQFDVLCLLFAAVCCIAVLTGCEADSLHIPALPAGLFSELQTTTTVEPETTTSAAATTATSATKKTTTTQKTTTTTTAATTTTTTTEITTSATATELTIGDLTTVTTLTTPNADPDAHGLTPEYRAFLSDTVFVGDSICSGLRLYGIIPDDNCVAVGCVGARSIMEYKFPVRGNEYYIRYALYLLQPKNIIFSMGMNDVNMTDSDTFCENYRNLLDMVQELLPDAKLFVATVTPIAEGCTFSTNERISNYNNALRESLEDTDYGFVDIRTGLETESENGSVLNPEYNGGDGVHLMPQAYDVILKQVCEQLVDNDLVGGVSSGIPYGSAT